MKTIQIAPHAGALLKSLRGFGYSPETALADLIDNSISAGAGHVEFSIDWNEANPRIAVLDDGRGMTYGELEDGMRFGGDEAAERGSDDLGRFGLGMKTASLSQCQRLTVVSRKNGNECSMCWDVDKVITSKDWSVDTGLHPSPFDHVAIPSERDGTLVALERMDELGGFFGLDKEGFFAKISDVRDHFAMVFHRFIDGDARRVRITVNGRPVAGWDPMLRTHPATRPLGAGVVGSGALAVKVSPFVLPHRDRFANEAEFTAAGGPGGWAERQGFYVYRAKRLVVAGSWLGLGGHREWTKDESSRLARISIDLPQSADAQWRIDVRKARSRPPAVLRTRLSALGGQCRERAREVFAWRGGQIRTPSQKKDVEAALWNEEHRSGKRRYRINREHPIIAQLLSSDPATKRLTRTAITLIERSVPVERIWLDISENVEAASTPEAVDTLLVDDLVTAIRNTRGNRSGEEILDGLLRSLRLDGPDLRKAVLTKLETSYE
ncbi:ATP-binding protein (plasmid) [Rhizobium sp. B230/85]|uniref:ATP-binding protein n=1 Tax=unclassified Rhizobium TaxID=2613769 RepID=UPI001AD9EBD1|nr:MULTISPECIES: ATP-binding protein [unclassified Rhizobium]MBO9136204.1 ATP-binding protein [Rhizobium sp. B209b/85]QXZ99894.1 ATP-binding protein [Rhizobium sp. B230/85]